MTRPSGSLASRARLAAAVLAGGMAGALLRAGLEVAWPPRGHWPWATLVANLAGTAALGYFVTRLQERLPPSTYRRPLLGSGLCGALTTFSTVQVEALALARAGRPAMAAGYLAASVGGGLAVVLVTTHLVRRARVSR